MPIHIESKVSAGQADFLERAQSNPKTFELTQRGQTTTIVLLKPQEYYIGDTATKVLLAPGSEWSCIATTDEFNVYFTPPRGAMQDFELLSWGSTMGKDVVDRKVLGQLDNLQIPKNGSIPLLEACKLRLGGSTGRDDGLYSVKAGTWLSRGDEPAFKLDFDSAWDAGTEAVGNGSKTYKHLSDVCRSDYKYQLSDITKLTYHGPMPEDSYRRIRELNQYEPMKQFLDTCLERDSSYFTWDSTHNKLTVDKTFPARLGWQSDDLKVIVPEGTSLERNEAGQVYPTNEGTVLYHQSTGRALSAEELTLANGRGPNLHVRVGDIEKMLSDCRTDVGRSELE